MNVEQRPETALAAGTLIGARYQIVRAIAQGGMGAVYEACDARLNNRRCALKVLLDAGLSATDRAEAAAWFAREATLLSSLRHPLIPTIGDSFSEQGRHYLVMDFIAGETLEDLLARQGAPGLPVADVLDWGRHLCAVLSYLHTRQPPVIFRDLKPANIMRQHDGTLKLIDFGIARVLEPKRTGQTVHTMIGTPGYSPPEQYQGLDDARSDLYSLGATLHHLLSGRDPRLYQPFVFPPLAQSLPAIDPAIAAAIARAVSLLAHDRFATARECAAALTTRTGRGAAASRAAAPPQPVALNPPIMPARPVLTVSAHGQGRFTTISQAIRQAQPGTRIEVMPGTYAECIIIDRPLEIVAVGPVEQVIVETTAAPCLVMNAETALVQGFTLRGGKANHTPTSAAPAALPGTQSLIVSATSTMTRRLKEIPSPLITAVKNILDTRPCHAVDVEKGRLVLRDCRITSDSHWCVVAVHGSGARPLLHRCVIHGGRDAGLHFYAHGWGTLEDCSILENGTGVVVTEGSSIEMKRCDLRGSRGAGMEFYKKGQGRVENCTIHDNGRAGIEIGETASAVIRQCHINSNGGSAIHLHNRAGGTVENCDLTNNLRGAWNTIFRREISGYGNKE